MRVPPRVECLIGADNDPRDLLTGSRGSSPPSPHSQLPVYSPFPSTWSIATNSGTDPIALHPSPRQFPHPLCLSTLPTCTPSLYSQPVNRYTAGGGVIQQGAARPFSLNGGCPSPYTGAVPFPVVGSRVSTTPLVIDNSGFVSVCVCETLVSQPHPVWGGRGGGDRRIQLVELGGEWDNYGVSNQRVLSPSPPLTPTGAACVPMHP